MQGGIEYQLEERPQAEKNQQSEASAFLLGIFSSPDTSRLTNFLFHPTVYVWHLIAACSILRFLQGFFRDPQIKVTASKNQYTSVSSLHVHHKLCWCLLRRPISICLEYRCTENENACDNLGDIVSSGTKVNHKPLTEQSSLWKTLHIKFYMVHWFFLTQESLGLIKIPRNQLSESHIRFDHGVIAVLHQHRACR